MVRNYLLLATFALGVMFAEQATAQSWTQVGTLSCRVDPNIGFIIVGHQPMQCVYTQAPNAIPQVSSPILRRRPQYDRRRPWHQYRERVGLGGLCTHHGRAGWRARRRVCRRLGRCRSRSRCGCECASRRIEPYDSLAAAVASGVDRDQRDRGRVIAQAALALGTDQTAQLRFKVIDALTTWPAPCESISTLCLRLRVTMMTSAAKPALSM